MIKRDGARAMEHQPALLLGRLDWQQTGYYGSCDLPTADGLPASAASFFWPFDVRLDVGRRHQPHGIGQCLQLA